MSVLTEAVSVLATSTARLDDHDTRIHALEVGYGERVVSRLESAAAWRAVEAVANSAPPDESGDPESSFDAHRDQN